MSEYLRKVVWMDCIQDVEEELARRLLILGEFVGEEHGEFGVVLECRPQLLHRQLVILRDVNITDGGLLEKPLLVSENLLEEVFVDLARRRQVVLEVLIEILNEVGL